MLKELGLGIGNMHFKVEREDIVFPNSGFTPGTPVFTHFTSARRRYTSMDGIDKH